MFGCFAASTTSGKNCRRIRDCCKSKTLNVFGRFWPAATSQKAAGREKIRSLALTVLPIADIHASHDNDTTFSGGWLWKLISAMDRSH
jgi:hypothetical protein